MTNNSQDNTEGDNLHVVRLNHQWRMSEAFASMFYDSDFVDCSISCDGEVIKAHRMVLAASSSYFRHVFSTLDPNQYPVIFVTGVAIDDWQVLLQFMYKGEVTIPREQLPSLVKSAEFLQIMGLQDVDASAQLNKSENQNEKNLKKSKQTSDDGPSSAKRKKKRKNETIEESEKSDQEKSSKTKPSEMAKNKDDGGVSQRLRQRPMPLRVKLKHDFQQQQRKVQQDGTSKEKANEDRIVKSSPKPAALEQKALRSQRQRRTPVRFDDRATNIDSSGSESEESDGNERSDSLDSNILMPTLKATRRSQSQAVSLPGGNEMVLEMHEEEQNATVTSNGTSISKNIRTRMQSKLVKSTTGDNHSLNSTDENDEPPKNFVKLRRKSIHSSTTTTTTEVCETMQIPVSSPLCVTFNPERSIMDSPVSKGVKKLKASNNALMKKPDGKIGNSKVSPSKMKLDKKKDELEIQPSTSQTLLESSTSPVSASLDYEYRFIEERGIFVYKCMQCEHNFRSKRNVIDHVNSIHMRSSERYTCNICNKEFKWRTSLNSHLNQKHPHTRPSPMRHFPKKRT